MDKAGDTINCGICEHQKKDHWRVTTEGPIGVVLGEEEVCFGCLREELSGTKPYPPMPHTFTSAIYPESAQAPSAQSSC